MRRSLIKDGLRKFKEERIPRNISLAWTVGAKDSLIIKWGFGPNQLVFRKNPGIPNIAGELTHVSTEIGGEEEYLRNILDGMRKAREIHVQQESDYKIKRALKGRIHEQEIEEIEEIEEIWREPAVVIGRDRKNVIVKHGGMLREIMRIHMTRIKGE